MNKTFRLIWSAVREAWVVVAEKVTAKGGIPARTVAAVALLALSGQAHALPQGGQVVGGNSAIGSPANGQMVINQNSPKSIINWQSYGIAAGEKLQYIQPGSGSISLNRVTGVDPSVIHGQLSANGNVWVINPNGLLIGNGAQVNVGGFLGSTLNIGNEEFMNGSYRFRADRSNPGSISNLGSITTADGGYVMLIAPTISNQGTITTNLGKSYLASGNEVTLSFAGNDLLGFTVDKGVLNGESAGIDNSGRISANGGEVILSAKSANDMLKSVVNNTGVIEARTVENRSGRIFLLGDMASGTVNVGGTLDASAPSPQPSPTRGEGAETPLSLDGRGAGGEGGTANGGFIETSAAHVKIADDAQITTKAENGQSGTWLIDPVDFTIAASGGDMTGAVLTQSLNGTNVTILSTDGATGTAGDINVNDTVTWSANTLTLNAQNNININSAMMGSGTAGLALQYGQGAVAAGNTSTYKVNAPVNLASTGSFSTKLGNDVIATPWTVITTLGAFDSSTATDLQGMTGNKAGNYVLGANIDASATATWNDNGSGGFYGFVPVGAAGDNFTGSFDGLGHTVSNLYINRPATDYVGLFGYTDAGVSLRNVGLLNANVTGKSKVGALLGAISGTTVIDNSYATGTVSGVGVGGVGGVVGGLAGKVTTINDSHAAVTVSSGGNATGGLVGQAIGAINRSYATGNVSGTAQVGGLVGYTSYAISDSYATGNVTGTATRVGGLVGLQGTGSISNSYATGSVGGTSLVGGLVGSGEQPGSIATSYASGAVTGSGDNVGGLAGSHVGAIANSYATGSASGASNVGGLVGDLDGGAGAGTITNSYATGAVSASVADGGGLLGLLSNGATVTTSYWDTVTTLQGTSAGGAGAVGMTTAQLAAALPTGFASATWGNAGNQTTPYLLGHSGFDTAGPVYLGSDGAVNPTAYGVILNVTQLQAMGNNLAGKYVLGNDIDASATSGWNDNGAGGFYGFVPVGAAGLGNRFSGSFDGLGHTVSNLYINRPATSYVGLFGYVNTGVTLRNVGLLNVNVTGSARVGALLGDQAGGAVIDNSYATGNVSGTGVGGSVGGLAGAVQTINDSHAAVTVSSGGTVTGGLVGQAGSAINRSYATGNVSGTGQVGGLVGSTNGDITDSYATGTVTGTTTRVGGLVGYLGSSSISNSYATGSVGGASDVGGLVGWGNGASASIATSYASGAVTGGTGIGGLAGYYLGTIANSYATGSANGITNVGGLVGELDGGAGAGTITNSYATGVAFASTANGGGLLGLLSNGATVTTSYWDTVTTLQATSAGGAGAVGKTTAEMKSLATFAGWDIDDAGGTGKVWRIYDGYTYPLLRGFMTALNATPDYDGSGAALTNVAAYTVGGAYDAGKVLGAAGSALTLSSTAANAYTASLSKGLYSTQQGYDLITTRTISTPGSASGNIALTNPISWTSGTLAINTAGTITDTAAINGTGTAIFDLKAGTWSQVNAALPGFAAHDFRISGGSFVRALSGDGTVIPYVLGDIYGMQGMGSSGMRGKNYFLGNDVNATATSNWNGGLGFVQVGTGAGSQFTGSLNGQGHTVTGLYINRAGTDFIGLFGWLGGALSNIGLLGSNISGLGSVGALAGFNTGTITYSYADGGTVTGSSNGVGGLMGGGTGTIDYSYANVGVTGGGIGTGGLKGVGNGNVGNSYAIGSVAGVTDVGGLVGQQSGGTITNSYATGAVSGTNYVGGLTGSSNGLGGVANVANSYWDTQISGRATSYGGTGKTTVEMKQLATFTGGGWDIDDAGGTGKVWRIYEGYTNPLLRGFLTALTVTANNATTTYSGTGYSGGNGVTKSDPAAVLLGSASYSGSSQGAVNVGSYTITPGGYYSNQLGYDITFANGALTINPAPLSLLSVTANNIGKTYGTAYTFNGTEFTSVGLQGGDTIGSVTLTSAGAPASASVGSYAIVPSNASGGTFNPANYIITYVNGTLTVTPAPLTVTANNAVKTYDGLVYSGNNGVSYSGFVNDEGTSVLAGTLSYGGSSQGAKNPGSYSITPSGLTSGNYSITFTDGTLTINKADAIVTANSGSTVYNGLPQNVTGFTASGLVGGETASVLTGITTSGGTGTNAGTYAHTIGGTDGNYNLTFVDGSLVITPAPLAVTANNASKTYDGLTYSGGYGVGYSGFVNGETSAVLGGSLNYGGNSQGAKNAGSYTITPSGLASGNYTISYHNGILSVSPVQLVITADAQSKLYGNADPKLTYGAVGLQARDTAASVLSGNLTREPGEGIGSYAIGQGSLLANGNYLLSYSGDALAIRPNQTYEEARAAGFQAKALVADAPANLTAGQLFTVDYDSFKAWQSAALPLSEK